MYDILYENRFYELCESIYRLTTEPTERAICGACPGLAFMSDIFQSC